MKFSAQTSLVGKMAGYCTKLVSSGTATDDTGRFVTVKTADNNRFSLTVNREDVIGNVTVMADQIDDEDILSIQDNGSYAIEGRLLKMIGTSRGGGAFEFEYKENPVLVEQAGEELSVGPVPVGQLMIKRPGLRGMAQNMWYQSFRMDSPEKIESNRDKFVRVTKDNLSDVLEKIGIAVAKNMGNVEHSHVRLLCDEGKLQVSAFQGHILACATCEAESGEKFEAIVPYDVLSNIVSMACDEEPLMLYQVPSSPPGMVVHQKLMFNNKEIGRTIYRIFSAATRFTNLKKTLSAIDFNYSCKVKGNEFKIVAADLAEVSEEAKTQLFFMPASNMINFKKDTAACGIDKMELPISDATGEELDMFISSRMLKSIASKCSDDDVSMEFSGSGSLVLVKPDEGFKVYFQPMTRQEDE